MKEGSKMSWADPKMLELDALPEALGHCSSGFTASDGAAPAACQTGGSPDVPSMCGAGGQPVQSCHTGQVTSAVGTGHLCNSGGSAGGECNAGSSVQ